MINQLVAFLLVFTSFTSFAMPEWAKEIKKDCKKSELCAVGTGDTRGAAERNARVALSRIFDTKISSNLSSSLKSYGKNTEESVSEDIGEATELALSGLEIKKIDEDKTSFYALAVVNKSKAAAGFRKEIESIDGEMKAIFKVGDDVDKVKLGRLFVKREVLNKQYHFLKNQYIDSPISAEEIFAAKNNGAQNLVVHVYLDEDEPKSLEGALTKAISDLGFKSSSGRVRNKNSTHVITGEFVADKQYLKVDGFEKYKFVLKLKAMKADTKVETGHLNYEVIETGRNFSDANDKAVSKFQEYVKNNIENLNLR